MLTRKFSTFAAKPTSNFGRKLIGSGLVICSVGFGYLFLNSKKPERKSESWPLPAVDSMITMENVKEILSKNESWLKGTGSSIVRMDLNSVPSNNPSEDYHSEHIKNDCYILGVFDGHGGPECGELVSKTLSSYVWHHIEKVGDQDRPSGIKKAMQDAFLQMDHDITNGSLLSVPVKSTKWWNPLPKSVDFNSIMRNLKNATSGSCALVVYVEDNHLYLASIGDCRAVLGRKMGNTFQSIDLTMDQTGRSPTEFSRLCEEHPGEDSTIVIRGRVLGGLMPTRAFGNSN
jgi:pyruvate dehydrogenase phosphatase